MIPNDIETVLDGSVDAAGSGYGRSLQITQNKGSNPKYLMQIREGQWGSDKSKYSSKHRELQSLVESVKDDVREGQLTNGEVFLFNDKSITESAYYRGKSKNNIPFN